MDDNQPHICPFCGAKSVELEEYEIYRNTLTLYLCCGTCHTAWKRVFKEVDL